VSGSVTSFVDATVTGSTTYSYTIAALDAAGNASAQSSAAGATTPSGTPPADATAPSVPSGLTGSVVAAGRIDLAWSASSDDVAVAGYAVYRDGNKITSVPVGSTSYSDTGLTPGVSHTYTVTALDAAANESAQSGSWSGAASDAALVTSYAYDPANRLTQVATAGQTLGSYTYDGAGDRIGKTTASGSTAYTLDLASGLPQVLSETTGATTSTYAYAGGPLELDVAGTTYWYLTDSLGSIRAVTDANGDTPATYNYSAFGSVRTSTGSLANEILFAGERTDAETGLQYLNARTYDPATGTFLQRDTWGITPTSSQSINAYVYAMNSPVNGVDPSGHVTLNCRYGREDCDQLPKSIKASMPPVNATITGAPTKGSGSSTQKADTSPLPTPVSTSTGRHQDGALWLNDDGSLVNPDDATLAGNMCIYSNGLDKEACNAYVPTLPKASTQHLPLVVVILVDVGCVLATDGACLALVGTQLAFAGGQVAVTAGGDVISGNPPWKDQSIDSAEQAALLGTLLWAGSVYSGPGSGAIHWLVDLLNPNPKT
jgi:RHS repeat-associated protein